MALPLLEKVITIKGEPVTRTLYASGWWEATWAANGYLHRHKFDDWEDLEASLPDLI